MPADTCPLCRQPLTATAAEAVDSTADNARRTPAEQFSDLISMQLGSRRTRLPELTTTASDADTDQE